MGGNLVVINRKRDKSGDRANTRSKVMIIFRKKPLAASANSKLAIREDVNLSNSGSTSGASPRGAAETQTDGPDFAEIVRTMTKSRRESNIVPRRRTDNGASTRGARLTQRRAISPNLERRGRETVH